MTHTRAGLTTRSIPLAVVGVVSNPLVAGRMIGYGGVLFSDKTGAPLPTFLNDQNFTSKNKSDFIILYVICYM